MKKITKLLLLALTVALLVGTVFAVSVFAGENPLSTDYGEIPETYADINAYPFVTFEADGSIGGTNDNYASTWDNLWQYWRNITSWSVGYLRQNITDSTAELHFGAFRGEKVLDLNGFTLTASGADLFNNQIKKPSVGSAPTEVSWTIKNGTIDLQQNYLMKVNLTENGTFTKGTYVFENVTFNNVKGLFYEQSLSNNWGTPELKFVFKNCTFNVTGADNFYRAQNHANSGYFKVNIEFVGGCFNYASGLTAINPFVADPQNVGTKSVSFSKGTNGAYTCINMPKGTNITDATEYQTEDGAACFVADGDSGNYTVYRLIDPNAATPDVPDTNDVNNLDPYAGKYQETTLPDGSVVTRYGTIPPQKTTGIADDDYRKATVIIFNEDRSISGKPGSHNAASDWAAVFGGGWANKTAGQDTTTFVYLRTNVSMTNASNFEMGQFRGTRVFDLNGYTMTASDATNNTLLYNQVKDNSTTKPTSTEAKWVFINGTINLDGKSLLTLAETGTGTYTKFNKGTYIFENITFNGVNALISEKSLNGNWGSAQINIIFKNCTFNVTGAGNFFQAQYHANSNNYTVKLELEGGKFNYTNGISAINPFVVDLYNTGKKSITFVKNTDGEYTCINMPKGTNITDATEYQTEDGTRCFVADGDSGNYTVYRLLEPVVLDPIHPECKVNPEFPETDDSVVKIYDLQNNEIRYYSIMGTGGGFHLMAIRDKTDMYLLKDYTGDTWYDSLGTVRGEHSVDLQQHTITVTKNFFELQAKTSANSSIQTATITLKNGTIDISDKDLVSLSSISGLSGRQFTIIFENITFKTTKGYLVTDNGNGNSPVTNNIEFRNCTVETSSENAMFNVGVSANTTANVNFLGGKINYTGASIPAPYTNGDNGNSIVAFGKYENAYTSVTAPDTVDVNEIAYPTAEGNRYLRHISVKGGTATYTLSAYGFICTHLNLESDLNMIYGVFLPAGSDATVTFLIDNFITSVEPMGTDENGLYLFKLKGITPAKMNKEIGATLMVNGEAYDSCNSITIRKYLDKVKAGYSTNEKMMTLVDALLVYGAAAQQYVDGNTEGFDEDTVTALGNLGAIGSEEAVKTDSQTALKYFALSLDGAFTLRAGIVLDNTTDVTLEVTKNGETTIYPVSQFAAQGGIIAIPVADIYATELGTEITMVLKRGEEVIDTTLTVDANAYLYRASNSTNETLATLAKAIYAYGVAAKAYVTP